ncbi:hypothetical protein [Blastococcus sp. SYSU DS0973]
MAWTDAEPDGPGLDDAYIAHTISRCRAAEDAGLRVSLGTGLQFAPNWVRELPGGTSFVDQHGQTWSGGAGNDPADAVWNLRVRNAQERYLGRLAERLEGVDLAGLRVGGMGRDELRYPQSGPPGPSNRYWAYGPAAQADSPTPGFRPGSGSEEDAASFLDWYLESLCGYGSWQIQTYRELFGERPQLLVLQPSWGIRPGDIANAVAGRLNGTSRPEVRGTLAAGLDWARQADRYAAPGVALCTTWLDAREETTDLPTSPAAYLTQLGRQHGMAVWGENSGDDGAAEMNLCMRRIRDLRMAGLFWLDAKDRDVISDTDLDMLSRAIETGHWEPPMPGERLR